MRIYTSLFLLISSIAFSQEKIKHIVASGETLYSISKKYEVTASEILDLNPKIKESAIQLKSVLWIPNKNHKTEDSPKPEKSNGKEALVITHVIKHEVLAKETLYGISKKYNTTVDKIKEANPSITGTEITVGSKLTIPVSKEIYVSPPDTAVNSKSPVLSKVQKPQEPISQNTDEAIVHDVVAKETKYGISKRYNMTIAELEKLNPKITKGLSVGDHLIIREGVIKKTEVVLTKESSETKQNTTTNIPSMSADAATKAEFLISKASENLGVPYRMGGTDKNGFDCSGLIFVTYKEIDVNLPRTSSDMAANAGIKIDKALAHKGDLIFFDTMNRGDVSHVGMVTDVLDEEIKFIHASNSGVIISSTKEDYYSQRLLQINRVLE